MARTIYIDGFSGAAGDMLLGAFLDAGLPEDALRHALGSLGVGHTLRVSRVVRAGLSAVHVKVGGGCAGDRHGTRTRTPGTRRQSHGHRTRTSTRTRIEHDTITGR